jgi:ParB family chromosome partitioning protein
MITREVPIEDVDISEFNTRKNLTDGQQDSTIEDLAKSIEKQGLLNPIMVFQRPDGRYALIAGQRRLLACKQLGWSTISAIVRDSMTDIDAITISLVENVHRADMNPRDKAIAFKTLFDKYGDWQAVSRETGMGIQTIRKYVQLLDLATQLQEKLAAGEARNTEALARLARQFDDPNKQLEVWDKIAGFRQDVQQEIIKRADPDLHNLGELVAQAVEGAFDFHVIRNCPFDCRTIPEPLKMQVASMIETFRNQGFKEEVKKQLNKSS